MGYIYFNPNPAGKMVGDCVIRALSKLLGETWESVFANIVIEAFKLSDMPSSNYVTESFLKSKGFVRYNLPNTCPDCYTIRQFCDDYPEGDYIVGTGSHMVAISRGSVYDSWDSSDEIVIFYYKKEMEE